MFVKVRRRLDRGLQKFPALHRVVRRAKRSADAAWLAAASSLGLHPTSLHRQANRMAAALRPGPSRPEHVVVFTGYQDPAPLAKQSAFALRLRGQGLQVTFLRCDRFLGNACNVATPPGLDPATCLRCDHFAGSYLRSAGFPTRQFGEYARPEDTATAIAATHDLSAETCAGLTHRGYPVGRLVRIQIARYQMDSTVRTDEATTALYRDYLATAIRLVEALERAFDDLRPDRLLMFSGNYLAEAVAMAVAARRKIAVTGWDGGYLPSTIIFTRDKPQDNHDARAWDSWKDVALTPTEEAAVAALLDERRVGRGTTHKYYDPGQTSGTALLTSLGIDPQRPFAAMFTNVAFDSSIYERDIVYPDYMAWVLATIRIFTQRPSWQLVVRTHPAENYFGVPAGNRVESQIRQAIGTLPPNVVLIGSTETVDSYALMDQCRVGLVANSTTGMEMAALGRRVVTVSAAHFRGKGFTVDPANENDYLQAIADSLDGRAPPLTEEQRTLARRYLYFTFYRLSVHVPLLREAFAGDAPAFLPAAERGIVDGDATLDRLADAIVGAPDYVAPPQPGRASRNH